MILCAHCKAWVPLDDVAIPFSDGRCWCLACFQREAGAPLRVPAALRRAIDGESEGG